MHDDCKILKKYKNEINNFLIENLKIELHSEKSKIIKLEKGINLLGYRTFYYHKLLRKANKRKFERKFKEKSDLYKNKEISYGDFIQSLQGWLGYAIWADTYKLRMNLIKNLDTSKIKIN